jgi:arsenate reductase
MNYPIRVLFLCTGNSCRSQMAEGLLRSLGGADFEAHSAGTEPRGLNPLAVEVMREAGMDISGQRSKPLETYLGQQFADRIEARAAVQGRAGCGFDFIITVCDRVRDRCPTFPGDNERIHWGFDDPAEAKGSHDQQVAVFRRVRNEISERIRIWVTVQRKRLKEQGLIKA